MGYLRTIQIKNGDMKVPYIIYECEDCKKELEEAWPMYRDNNITYCRECAFKNALINEQEYLKTCGIYLDNLHADVIDGEIILWLGNIHPLDKRRDKLDRRCKAYRDWRKAVFVRDGYICVRCDSNDRLEAHHIKEFSKYKKLRFNVKNGETLCYTCHKKAHKKRGGTDE